MSVSFYFELRCDTYQLVGEHNEVYVVGDPDQTIYTLTESELSLQIILRGIEKVLLEHHIS